VTLEELSRNEFNCKNNCAKFNLNNIEFVVTNLTYLEKNGMCRNYCDETIHTKYRALALNLLRRQSSRKKATLDYFDLLLPTITNNTVWIFDDIHWSSEMDEAWEMIKTSKLR
jgi:hypothetical protein